MTYWKRNLVFVWLSQFLSIMAFASGLPFVPYYIQSLGITDDSELKMWTTLFAFAAPCSLAIFSPIWGIVADRFGRKTMLLRAYFGATIVITLMGTVDHVIYLVILRFAQGMLTGTMTASQALIASSTPDEKSGFALGSLSSAVYTGGFAGNFLGGWVADNLGYRMAFYMSGVLFFICFFLVLFGVKEQFKPQKKDHEDNGQVGTLNKLWFALPVLILFLWLSFCRQFDHPMFPLLVQEIHGSLKGAATMTGSINGFCGLAGILAGLSMGWMTNRFSPAKIGIYAALLTGLMMIPQGFATTLALLFGTRFIMVFWAGTLDPALQVWLAKITPQSQRGAIFGWASSAKAVGWMLAPLLSGAIAITYNVRLIFFIGCLLYFLLIPLIIIVKRKLDIMHCESS